MDANLNIDVEGADNIRLLERCLDGDRGAYGQLVTRYQSLVCSIAYNACGNLARSEDLAQETFVTAWHRLRTLKDLHKFKSWLCGIARNLANNSIRQQHRNPVAAAAPLDAVVGDVSPIPSPAEDAISAEEEDLVWKSLQQMPDNYRQPLILFYREEQSVSRVAEALELTTGTVKQRLSRGRKLLKDEVARVVESTLTRSKPARAFTAGVLLALPAVLPGPAAAVAATTAANAAASAKAAASGTGGVISAALIKCVVAGLGVKMQVDGAQSPRERKFVVRLLLIGLAVLTLYVGVLVGVHWSGTEFGAFGPYVPAASMLLFLCAWIPLCRWGGIRIKQIRIEDGTWVEAQPVNSAGPGSLNTAGIVARFAIGTSAAAAWLAALAIRCSDWAGLAAIATASLLAFAIGLSFCLRRPRTYFKALGATVCATALAAILTMIYRLDLWTAQFAGSSAATVWLMATLNGTVISIHVVSLLAWKRDAEVRRSSPPAAAALRRR